LSKLKFQGQEASAARLSGGWKKRLGLACELILSPDVLFLDEPTNHLDLEGILWLEKFLAKEAPTYLVVSHDRYFLQNVTSRTVEIGPMYPKGMFAIDGTYAFC
jgi:ABC transport system ATP-binding/permease protein